jgi:polyribonucleotide 5'-hydroxyl-kinase
VPTADMVGKLLAITSAAASDTQESVRDASVRGYMWVADVDEEKRKVKVLCPQPGMVVPNALILGRWPEDVEGLVS